jgi:hypothetical protein
VSRRWRVAGAAALAVVVVIALVIALVLGVRAWRSAHRSDLERALSFAPTDAQRYSWTDWAAVRRAVGTSSESALLSRGYDEDLTAGSSLTDSAEVLRRSFGISLARVDWELFAQSTSGAVVIVKVPGSFDAIRDQLTEAGFAPPSSPTGVWDGSSVDVGAVPELQYAALDESDHLVLTSDSDTYLRQRVDRLGQGSLPGPVADVVARIGTPLSAEIYGGDYTCEKLAMSQADPADAAQGDQLIAAAGKVNPVLAFAMARSARSSGRPGDVTVAMAFADHGQAVTNADTRASLAAGPAPGQGGTFPDRFTLGKVTASGPVVTMDLHPKPGSFVLSDLSTGPLLFATC